jgi:hypothetical protein
MKILRLFLVAVLSLASLQAMAQRQPVPIINHENIPVQAASGKQLTAEQVKKAIMTASAPRDWTISEAGPGKLVGTLHVRGKHTIVVEIAYSGSQYSIKYRDSTNMKYVPDGATGTIHPFYNRWVDELRAAIRDQLSRA